MAVHSEAESSREKKYTERLGFKSRVVKVKKYCGNNSQKERRCAYEAPTSLFQGKNRPNSLRKNLLKFASRARRLKIRQNTARQKLFLPSFFGVVTCMKRRKSFRVPFPKRWWSLTAENAGKKKRVIPRMVL